MQLNFCKLTQGLLTLLLVLWAETSQEVVTMSLEPAEGPVSPVPWLESIGNHTPESPAPASAGNSPLHYKSIRRLTSLASVKH